VPPVEDPLIPPPPPPEPPVKPLPLDPPLPPPVVVILKKVELDPEACAPPPEPIVTVYVVAELTETFPVNNPPAPPPPTSIYSMEVTPFGLTQTQLDVFEKVTTAWRTPFVYV
jgi:hypothetical protein